MVVMVVAEQYQINFWQAVQGYSRFSHPFWSQPLYRTGSVVPYRVRKDVQLRKLDKKSGVVDKSNGHSAGFQRFVKMGCCLVLYILCPCYAHGTHEFNDCLYSV